MLPGYAASVEITTGSCPPVHAQDPPDAESVPFSISLGVCSRNFAIEVLTSAGTLPY